MWTSIVRSSTSESPPSAASISSDRENTRPGWRIERLQQAEFARRQVERRVFDGHAVPLAIEQHALADEHVGVAVRAVAAAEQGADRAPAAPSR